MNNEGYATFTVFTIILAISGILFLVSSFLFQNTRSLLSLEKSVTSESEFMEIADEICQTLIDDQSIEADSLNDEVWKANEKGYREGYSIELTELSSRLNPNFDNLDFWKLTNLKSRIKSSFAFSDWETLRMNQFAYTREELKDLVFEEDWETLYSLYSLINANSAPLEVIEAYLRQMGESENTISAALSRIRTGREAGDFISQSMISSWLSADTEYAVLNSQSKININFVDPLVLEAVLSYPWDGETVDNYLVMKNNILNARNSNEITEEQLRNLLDCDEEIRKEILKYLGDTSWFWNLIISNDEYSLDLMLCRIPSMDDDINSTGIQIVNKRFSKRES